MVNKREFPRDMSFVDRQGDVVHPSREDYNARKSANVGKAYGFFYCDASKQEIGITIYDDRRHCKERIK